jgi:hypothetical protein
MGYDAYAVALIGVRVDPDKLEQALYTVTTNGEPGCQHKVDKFDKFCPVCGKPTRQTIRTPIEGYDEENETLFGYSLLGNGACQKKRFIAAGYCRAGAQDKFGDCFAGMINLSDIQDKMKMQLEPLGLFNEKSFGIHVFLDESC